jgi:phosphoribosylanthranilate isomerase
MMVKICGITSLEDAMLAANAGASAIGFNFYPPSPRYIAPSAASRIARELPRDLIKAGIFVDQATESIHAIAKEVGLDVVQLHGPLPYGRGSASDAGAVSVLRVWRAFQVNEKFNSRMLDDSAAEAFLLDSPSMLLHGGTGQTFDWTAARSLGKRIVLAGGLDASNVRIAIEQAQPWGVDACSRLESVPGRKDPLKVQNFIKAALNL